MQRICLFRLGVTAGTLANVFTGTRKTKISGPALAHLSRAQLDAKLSLLREMRLIESQSEISNPKSEIHSVHPAIRDGFLATLDPAKTRRGHEAAREGLVASLGERPGSNPSDPGTLDLLEEIVHHALAAGHAQEAWDIYRDRIGGGRNLGWRLGAYERGERICRAFAAGKTPETAPLPDGLSEHVQAVFINEWAVYLMELGRLDAAARCYERHNEMQMRQESWKNASIGKANLAEAWLLAGRLRAGLTGAEEALRLAELANDAEKRCYSYAYRAHARALRGETGAALADFRDALQWQHKDEGESDWPLYSNRGYWHTLLLARLGRSEEAARLTEQNKEICREFAGPHNNHEPPCNLLLADLARERGDLPEAGRLLDDAHAWALARDAKEPLCWAELVRARIKIGVRGEGRGARGEEAGRAVEEGLRIARECGFGIYHIDLLLERCRLGLLRGDAPAAEADARTALFDGHHPPAESALPTLLAATDRECGYAWGIAAGGHLLAEALLLKAAQKIKRADYVPAKIDELPPAVHQLVADARDQLDQCRELRQRIQDPKIADTQRLLAQLDGGVLTRYPLAVQAPAKHEPPPGESVMKKRFRVALSFPGEHRALASRIATLLVGQLPKSKVFYDEFYKAELARPDLDTYLQRIYHDEADLLVVFLCAEYEKKEWCGLEWRAIRDLIKKKKPAAIMPIRVGEGDVSGLFSIDGYVNAQDHSPEELAALIMERLRINDG